MFTRVLWVIARALRALVGWLRGKPGLSVVPGFLRPIDTDAVARSERLDDTAAENGRAELPESNSQLPDAPEQGVTQRVLSEWSWQGGELVNQLRAYAARLAQYSIHSEHERLRLLAGDVLTRLRSAGIRAPAELAPLKHDYVAARDELLNFKERHRLKRPARSPTRRWTNLGLMVMMVAVESVLNGFFFAKRNSFGLVGGIGTAIGISITNVAFAFLLGLGLARWINYRDLLVRLSAFLLTAAGICLILGLHVFAVHFRDVPATVPENEAFGVAVTSLLREPWRVSDETSVYLFGLGVVFGLLAFWKGCTFDDPYPGYGPMHRREIDAREAYSEIHADLFDELERIKDGAVKELDEAIAKIPVFPQHAERVRSQRAALVESFRAYETAAESAANQLLARYRAANRRSRKTPPPAYFGETWKLPYRFVDSPQVRELIADVEAPQAVGSILADFRKLSQEILDEYTKLLKQYPHPSDMP